MRGPRNCCTLAASPDPWCFHSKHYPRRLSSKKTSLNPEGSKVASAGLLGLTLAFCFVGNSYQVFLVAMMGLTTIVGVGLNVLFGLSGQISLG